ncbi:MAG: hydantoinase/oxoprolinase family protein [Sandaracinaceae bacterium]|nr:hydantoinase/oxoprolinase family protein [Sandaracinaceae bacterium]
MPRVRTIVHGTTVTTNAVLTRGGARTGLVTTAGVRDALEMRRGIREEQYDNRYLNVEPLVPRNLRIGVRGRLDAQGAELEPLSLEDVREAARALSAAGVEAVAVCFMNSFAGGAHERAAAGVIAAAMPEAYVSVSSEVLPLIRFYDRVSTTALDAYTGPVLSRYLGSLARRLAEAGFGGVLLVMQSNGGVALADVVARRPATTLLSGPAAGPRAGLAYVEPLGERSCLVADMGGTSFDASLVDDGEVALKAAGEIARLRIALPMLDIVTIGAGGGSIGWIDAGGLLRMGPQSAGADPGPACYGRGGREPTCTDADLVLGYLDPRSFAGGRLALDEDAARAAIEERIARPLSLGLEEAAAGMVRVIDANMAHGIREITVKRGVDPRALPLVVAGGAGGLHACMVAAELGIRTIVVPPVASVLCASGMLLTDLGHDVVRSKVAPLEAAMADLAALVAEMIREGGAELAREGVRERDAEHRVALDLRYLKQYHEVTVPVARAWIEEGALEPIARAFHAAHDRLYGYELAAQGTPLELINVRVRSLGRVDKPPLPRVPEGDGDPRDARNGERRAYLPRAARFAPVPVYDGHRLRAGDRFEGPALVERTDTTLLVTSDYAARVDSHGTVVLVKSATEEEA